MVASSISTECELNPSAACHSSCLCQPGSPAADQVISGPVRHERDSTVASESD